MKAIPLDVQRLVIEEQAGGVAGSKIRPWQIQQKDEQ